MTWRATFVLSDDVEQTIRELAELDGVTMTEVGRRAVRLQQRLVEARISGERLLLQDPKSKTVREVVVW